eukprot:CAMPEP_0196764378 /NCGR_PEP_ID=MMETSP1095-20130614/5992_1 /TAXON_ID=96789 ORGANISM="Chromulina nebulosa, Strain UTEXLB2642" /NCGR_SAMPLE_ID=MMETSP1095 /ASSEMBLY_ACC=CAM_ASM_000446 /LENGTH=365 /DNA_ID=CAMNT_0042119797 /DNA_START=481 /DNA_END=1575 /DNA_ORIENTATION=+
MDTNDESINRETDIVNEALKSYALGLKTRVDEREDPTVIEAFMDLSDEILDTSSINEVWRAIVLFKVILIVGGRVISTITNLFEKYSTLLRGYSQSIASQKALVVAFYELHGNDGGIYHIILDILIRRGILQIYPIVDWLINHSSIPASTDYDISMVVVSLNSIHINSWTYQIIETLIDRSIDFVKASVHNYHSKFIFDLTIDSSFDVSSAIIYHNDLAYRVEVTNNQSNDIVVSNTINEDEEGDNRSRRFHDYAVDDDQLVAIDNKIDDNVDVIADEMNEDDDIDPKKLAIDGIILAVANARSVYSSFVTKLLQLLIPLQLTSADDSDSSLNSQEISLLSLLRRIVRSYDHIEHYLIDQYKNKV